MPMAGQEEFSQIIALMDAVYSLYVSRHETRERVIHPSHRHAKWYQATHIENGVQGDVGKRVGVKLDLRILRPCLQFDGRG